MYYGLTPKGRALANTIRQERGNVRWSVINYLSRFSSARERRDVIDNTGANGATFMWLKDNGIIYVSEGVSV